VKGERWRLAASWALVAVAALRLALFAARAAVTPTHGFVAYYTAARLVVEGQPVAQFYEDRWFQAQMLRFEPQANDIFRPNPPTAALLLVPLTWLNHDAARVVWIGLSGVLLAAAGLALLRTLAWPVAWQQAFWLLVVCFQPVWVNFAYGQAYLLLFALLVLAWRGYARQRPALWGAALGTLLSLKTAAPALWLLAALRRQWRAWAVALGVTFGVAALAVPFTGWQAWPVYFRAVRAVTTEPNLTVTAYQTLVSAARHLFRYEAAWNPWPWFEAPALAWWLPALGTLAVLALSAYIARAAYEPRLAFAAFTLSGLAVSPLSLDYHFVLALVPIALLAAWLRTQPRQAGPWIVLALGTAAIALPWPYQSPRLEHGLWAVLAYPKLYGTLLLWGLAIWGSLRGDRPMRPLA
jgi:hypothetical protein